MSAPYGLLYDLRWMELGTAGGIEQATYELVSAISRLDRTNRYHILGPRSACCEWDFPRDFRVDLHYSDEGAGAEILAARGAFDLVHSVAGYTHPEVGGWPAILTMNDLQHLSYPEFFSPEDWKTRELFYRQSAVAARHIICISEFTRQDMHRKYGIPLEKMTTIWIIPSRNAWVALPEAERASLLAAMGVAEPFLFFPAHCWPHKNHARLAEAVALVDSSLPPGLKVVLTGRPFPADHPAAELVRANDLGSRIVHLGYRSPLEVLALFQGCQAVVFPSLFEGFGMPVAEGIISGKPILCSNVTSLPEIAGDAAITFDPLDVPGMAARIVEIATQPALRASLAQAAHRRRSIFSARRTAVQTLAVYQGVADEIRG